MNASRHLTEAERHDVADGTASAEQLADVTEHLGRCDSCATDVARIKQLMTRIVEMPRPVDAGADLWPEIRSRIERDKIVQLTADVDAARKSVVTRRQIWFIVGNLAAVALIAVSLPRAFRNARDGRDAAVPVSDTTNMSLVADTVRAYEQEATFLLNELEMRRAMMRPQTRAAVDHDLDVIDKAIAELKEAIARDPKNGALRQLLASSYKQKVELLKRVTAG